MPEISVVMTVFNGASHLEEAIRSVLAQTFTDFELIIIDDASTDESLSIVQGFADERIRIVQNEENLGLTKSLNKGISLAQGKYIARMDSDDLSLPMRFEKQVAFLNAHLDVGVCSSWVELIGEQAGIVWTYPEKHASIQADMLFESQLIHPAVMMRRDVLGEASYDERFSRAQDYELWVRLARRTHLANLQEVLLKYRLHSGQIGAQHEDQQQEFANEVRLTQLSALGLIPSAQELVLHQQLSLYRFDQSEVFLAVVDVWLQKIEVANRVVNYYDHLDLQKTLGRRWWAVLKGMQGLGLKTWWAYIRSPLRVWVRVSLYEHLKFFVYCFWNQIV